jgi:hypothetical protein
MNNKQLSEEFMNKSSNNFQGITNPHRNNKNIKERGFRRR